MKQDTSISSYQEKENQQKAKLLSSVLWGTLSIINSSILLAIIVLPENYIRWSLIIVFITLLCLTLIYLNRKGWTKISSAIFTFSVIAVMITLGWSAGGMESPAMQDIPIMVMVAGILLGWRMGLLSAIVALLGGLFLVFAQIGGYFGKTSSRKRMPLGQRTDAQNLEAQPYRRIIRAFRGD